MRSSHNDALHFILNDIRQDWIRTLLSIIVIGSIVFIYFILSAFSLALNEFNQTTASGRNLIVVQSDLVDPTDASLAPSVLEAIRAIPATLVSRYAPVIYRHMRIGDQIVMLRAAPLDDWETVFHISLIDGDYPNNLNEVAVGEGAAEAYGWGVGEILNIYGSEFQVSGITRSPGTAFSSVWMQVESAQALFGMRRGYQALYVVTNAMADSDEVKSLLEEAPAIKGVYSVFYEDTYTRRDNQLMKDLSFLMRIVSYLALLAVTTGSFTSTSLSLTERTRELGILRAIGFKHSAITWLMGARAVIQSWAAFAAGLVVSACFIAYQQGVNRLYVLGFYIDFKFDWQQILAGFLLTSILAGWGAWSSSRHILKMQVNDLMKGLGL